MITTNCEDCVHKDLCKNKDSMNSLLEKTSDIKLPDNVSVVISCKNFRQDIYVRGQTKASLQNDHGTFRVC